MIGVGVPEQHPHVPVAADRGYLGHRQPKLEQPGNRLVPEIMEVQILYVGSLRQPVPCEAQRNRSDRKQPAILCLLVITHVADSLD